MSYEILVKHLGDGIVAQQVNRLIPVEGKEPLRETMLCQMINVHDPAVEKVLKEMGWMAPIQGLKSAIDTVLNARSRARGIYPPLHDAIENLKQFL